MNPLLLLFLLLPVAEIATFVEVGDWIGAGPTVGLVILSAVLGSLLIRWQGLSVLRRAQEAAQRGEFPVGAVFEGFCVVAAGVLLIIPGFLTDIVGLLLFVPPLRNALGRWLFDRLRGNASFQMYGQMGGRSWSSGESPDPRHRPPPGVIDGDYREVDPAEPQPGDAPQLGESRWAPPDSRFRNDHR
ncbi:FxsA family protein [Azospirillum sp. sgz302134]